MTGENILTPISNFAKLFRESIGICVMTNNFYKHKHYMLDSFCKPDESSLKLEQVWYTLDIKDQLYMYMHTYSLVSDVKTHKNYCGPSV